MATMISVALGFGGCSQQSKTTTDQNIAFNDKSQIEVATYGYLIEKDLNRSTNTLFVSADKDELRMINAKLPNHHIKPATQVEIIAGNRVQDKISKEDGVILEVNWVEIKGQQAEVGAGYFSGVGITFNFTFKKDNGWHLETVSRPTVADPF
jgi:hypothetical protein